MSQGPTVYLETFGCQMNELDSELVRGHLRSLGYRFVEDFATADVVLYNTCSVREQAENKAYSRLGLVGLRKKAGEQVVLGVLGCMAERDGADMLRRFPQVDLLCGPGELDRLPALIDNVRRTEGASREERMALAGNKSRRSTTLAAAEDQLELLDLSRAFDPVEPGSERRSAYVRITRGCNKFCTYCVVPNTRGAEIHRPPDAIVEECRRLIDAGVIEITLLGQTVNHYRYTHGAATGADGREQPQVGPGLAAFRQPIPAGQRTTTFARLLERIHDEVPDLKRLRFVTSYPRDFGDDILDVMAACPRICRYIHAPAQSGSDRILKAMNRGYTRAEYLEFIDRVTARLPDCTIAGDIIVGFPTESDAEFEETVSLVRAVPFKNNFIFKYSPRPGTVAIDRYDDDVPTEVKKLRNNLLLDVQTEVSARVHAAWVGRTVDILVEQVRRDRKEQETAENKAVSSLSLPLAGSGSDAHGGDAHGDHDHPASRNVEVRWARRSAGRGAAPTRTQVTGRTAGDLIVAVPLEDGVDADALVGSILQVEVTSSAALILAGRLVTAVEASERR
ncbi:MAG: tRNA (N6-isopentenyl adenosine(37)-C2)-methylthiotransferase MiaB [Planctomycetota bacterium]